MTIHPLLGVLGFITLVLIGTWLLMRWDGSDYDGL